VLCSQLAEARVPHILMTNGGGVLESVKARELSDKLGCEVSEDQILLSHTPMRQLAQEYRDKWVLVLGHKDVVNVARTYGFNKVTTVDEVFARFPSMIPFFKPKSDVAPWKGDVIDAAMVFYGKFAVESLLELSLRIGLNPTCS
jgi:ribonucleotide monophosphatase NagD (HAD superfamily)